MKVLYLALIVSLPVSAQKIRVVTEHLPPYQIVDKGKLVGGVSYDLVAKLLSKTKLSSSIEALPWARAYSTALTEKNVVIFSIVRSPERENKFKWIGKLRSLKFSFFSLRKSENIQLKTRVNALNYVVAISRGSAEDQYLQSMGFIPNLNLVHTVDYLSAWKLLLMGRVDLTYSSNYLGDYIYKGLGETVNPFVKKLEIDYESELYIAASLGTDDSIVKELSDALVQITD